MQRLNKSKLQLNRKSSSIVTSDFVKALYLMFLILIDLRKQVTRIPFQEARKISQNQLMAQKIVVF